MVTSILDQDGFKIIKTAGTVAEALKICRDWKPDLTILDVMPVSYTHLDVYKRQIFSRSHGQCTRT